MKNDKNNLIEKLQKHERSAREIGNIGEADNFKAKIEELLSKYKAEFKVSTISIDAFVECSCGFTLDIKIEAGELSRKIFESFITPHTSAGHTVTIYEK